MHMEMLLDEMTSQLKLQKAGFFLWKTHTLVFGCSREEHPIQFHSGAADESFLTYYSGEII